MCGFAGYLNFNDRFDFDREKFLQFTNVLKYRGPDSNDNLTINNQTLSLNLTHYRLGIIDLSEKSSQPMTSSSGKTIIVYNGEIYNYKTLRQQLSGFSVFNTQSDTEVILNAYEAWGLEKTLESLDGMFAFALFDLERESVVLARDRFGKKPLYYSINHQRIVFGSDIRVFDSIENLSLNKEALGHYFYELATPGEQTIWNEVRKLPVASSLVFNNDGHSLSGFWQPVFNINHSLSGNAIVDKTKELLSKAVQNRTVSDVPIGVLLSGGIDSSLVTYYLSQSCSERITSFTVGFRNSRYDEKEYARKVSKICNTNYEELIIDENDISVSMIDQLIIEYGEPFADSSMIPTYLISKALSGKVKVVLGGDGADELFGGYYSYYLVNRIEKFYPWLKYFRFLRKPSQLFKNNQTISFFTEIINSPVNHPYKFLERKLAFTNQDLKQIVQEDQILNASDEVFKEVWSGADTSDGLTQQYILSSLKTRMLNDYLVKVDRASMYASVEMRSPFLDRSLTEFILTVDPDHHFIKYGTKSILKTIASGIFGEEFVNRKKMGFSIPLDDLLRTGPLNSAWKERVLSGKQNFVEFNYHVLEDMISRHSAGENLGSVLWSIYVFHVWAQNQGVKI